MIILTGIVISSCTKANNSATTTPTTTPCTVNGTSVNIGGSAGNIYAVGVGPSNTVYLNNINLNISISSGPNSTYGTIMSVGKQTCLDFTYSGTPFASNVAYATGVGYVGQFADGHIVKFIAGGYSNGVGNIDYIFQ